MAERIGRLEAEARQLKNRGSVNTADLEFIAMSITLKELEKRVTLLETALQEMKTLLTKKETEPPWERTAGMFEGDEMFDEIVEEMRKARQADYEAVCKELDREADVTTNRNDKPVRRGYRKTQHARKKGKL